MVCVRRTFLIDHPRTFRYPGWNADHSRPIGCRARFNLDGLAFVSPVVCTRPGGSDGALSAQNGIGNHSRSRPSGFLALDVPAPGTSRSNGYTPRSSSSSSNYGCFLSSGRSEIKCESCPRDNRDKIKRDPKAKSHFKRTNPRPPGCDRCEVDHIVPLSKGGQDHPSNMQWLPREQHRDKMRRDLGR